MVFRLHEVPSSGNDPERQGTGEGRVVYMYRAQGRNQKRRNKFPRGNKADLAPKPSAIRGVKKKKRFKKKKNTISRLGKLAKARHPQLVACAVRGFHQCIPAFVSERQRLQFPGSMHPFPISQFSCFPPLKPTLCRFIYSYQHLYMSLYMYCRSFRVWQRPTVALRVFSGSCKPMQCRGG